MTPDPEDSSSPSGGSDLPPELAARFADAVVELVWSQVPESATWRLRDDGGVRYLKVTHRGWYPSASAEGVRLEWASAHLPVPRVLDLGANDDVEWLITAPLPGADATRSELDPALLVGELASGLRRFHDVPVAECPFRFDLDTALAHVRRRAREGQLDPTRCFHPEHAHHTVETALTELEERRPETENLVVCHGDYCLPNVLLEAGRVTSFLDLGELGIADRWWDLAVATWSLTWNLGEGHEEAFLAAYGARLEPERIRYYRLLYDLAS